LKDKTSKQGEKEPRVEDLDQELIGKEVEVVLQSGGSIAGRVAASSRYWVKLDVRGKLIYINKPFIVFIKPVS